MDFDINPEQRQRLARVDEVVESCGGIKRAQDVASAGQHDAELDAKLGSAGLLESATPLERVLIAEHLARLGTATTFGLRAVLSAPPLDDLEDGPVAVVDLSRRGPTRFGAQARVVLVFDGDRAWARTTDGGPARPVRSSFGYPYAHLDLGSEEPWRALGVPAHELRRRLRLALAAEISGALDAGIEHTAAHLTRRRQFGRRLSSFQALRHRLAEAAVSAEGTRWLVREAAWSGEPRSAGRAAAYAGATAAAVAPELTQMCGARAFAVEFGLHVHTMRLEGLRLELGGSDRIAVELAGASDA